MRSDQALDGHGCNLAKGAVPSTFVSMSTLCTLIVVPRDIIVSIDHIRGRSNDPPSSGDPIIERVSEQRVHDDDDDSFLAVEREVPEL